MFPTAKAGHDASCFYEQPFKHEESWLVVDPHPTRQNTGIAGSKWLLSNDFLHLGEGGKRLCTVILLDVFM